MNVLTRGPAAREDRYASALQHDHANARIVAFHLTPGQRVPPHSSDSTVVVLVTEGSGVFSGADGSSTLQVGEGAVYEPGETHSIHAADGALRFLAIITPRPGG